jgi:hypothetical protein
VLNASGSDGMRHGREKVGVRGGTQAQAQAEAAHRSG